MFAPVLDLLHAHGARDKVCHPELVSGSKLSAKHTSPYPVLDLLHAHGDSTKSLRLSRLVPFAIRTYFVSSVRKSASYLGEGEVSLCVAL